METIRYIAVGAAAILLTALGAGCTQEKEAGEGTLSFSDFSLAVGNEITVESNSSRAGEGTFDWFVVTLSNNAGKTMSWNYGELPSEISLQPGTYGLTVESHKVQDAEFNAPYYLGSTNVTIVSDNTQTVGTVQCALANIAVSVSYSAGMYERLGDDVAATVTIGGGELVFAKGTTDKGYFKAAAATQTMYVTLSGTIDGYAEEQDFTVWGVAAGEHRKIKFLFEDDGTLAYEVSNSGSSFEDLSDGDDWGVVN